MATLATTVTPLTSHQNNSSNNNNNNNNNNSENLVDSNDLKTLFKEADKGGRHLPSVPARTLPSASAGDPSASAGDQSASAGDPIDSTRAPWPVTPRTSARPKLMADARRNRSRLYLSLSLFDYYFPFFFVFSDLKRFDRRSLKSFPGTRTEFSGFLISSSPPLELAKMGKHGQFNDIGWRIGLIPTPAAPNQKQ